MTFRPLLTMNLEIILRNVEGGEGGLQSIFDVAELLTVSFDSLSESHN